MRTQCQRLVRQVRVFKPAAVPVVELSKIKGSARHGSDFQAWYPMIHLVCWRRVVYFYVCSNTSGLRRDMPIDDFLTPQSTVSLSLDVLFLDWADDTACRVMKKVQDP